MPQLRRRLESVKRIHKASDTVEQRLEELSTMQTLLLSQHDEFTRRQNVLVNLLIEAEVANTPPELEDAKANVLYWEHKVNF